MNIGDLIRSFRKEKAMTLLALSEKSGVALATLSRIENNKMTGTLASHMAICGALDVALPDLYKHLTAEKYTPEVQTAESRTEVFVHDKRSISEILVPKVLDKKMMPIMIKLEPKGSTHMEETNRGTEKFIFVLDGKVEASVGEKVFTLNKGDTLYFESSASHYFKNIGASEARLICVSSPPVL